jgi:glucose/arabinose dehydrogenase/thiol-disulfide isomerase/thioredoxin
MTKNTRLVATGIVALLVCVCATYAAELPHGFRLEPVVGGLTEPSSLAYTPDGRILITERTTGNLRVLQGGELDPSPLCTIPVTSTGDAGLLGVAVHPGFVGNGWIYLFYTDSGTGLNKLTRYTVGAAGCTGALDIFSDLGAGASFLNNGGGMAFGPDGKLYVGTGDCEDSANAQNGTLMGKILRVNDDGTVPADNPTPGSFIYSSGVRNACGVAVGETGQVYANDVDSGPGDELNAVAAGGNLGWETCPGTCEDPLAVWDPPVGIHGLTSNARDAFPDFDTDGIDNDHDRRGADRFYGAAKTDDDGDGVCVGSDNYGTNCTADADCPPRSGVLWNEVSYCEFVDEVDEWCPGGTPYGDDACDDLGAHGVDEADESYVGSLFAAGGTEILRGILAKTSTDQLANWQTFLDSSFLVDCPTGWTGVMTGRDGLLYAVADNGGGAGAGALYRVVHDTAPGPREVSMPGSHFPLKVAKGATSDEVVLYFEDLREDATQPRDDGNPDPVPTPTSGRLPAAPEREYTVWMGDLGTWSSHAAVPGMDAVQGTAVNDAYRTVTVTGASGDQYFLVSGRGDNLEGTLGMGNGAERTGYAVTDLCANLGYYHDDNNGDQEPDWTYWTCGGNFELVDEQGDVHNLYEYRGQVLMIDFSTIWCGPCNSEAEIIELLNQDFKDRNVQVLTVLVDEDDQLNDFLGRPQPPECRTWGERTNPHTFPCWVDPNPPSGETQKSWPLYYNSAGVPQNVILDSGLRVVWGYGGYYEAEIRNRLDLLVGATDQCLH